MKEKLILFLKGVLMGIADIIPGVSGGTMALITGIYSRLVYAISHIDLYFITDFFKGNLEDSKKRFKSIDFRFLLPVAIGITITFLLLSKVIRTALLTAPGLAYAFFFGLILVSAVFVYRQTSKQSIVAIAIGFLFAFFFVGLNPISVNHSFIVLFISGAIAVCAMLLPGISGAFILLFLGQYEYMLNVLASLRLPEIIVFSVGMLFGLFSFSKAIEHMIEKHRAQTFSFLTGMMLGSLRIPYQNIMAANTPLIQAFVAGVIGFLVVVLVEWKMLKG